MEWKTKVSNQEELAKDLMAHEVMRLRRDCERMYDALKLAQTDIYDVYETPKDQLEKRLEKLHQTGQSIGIIMGHIEKRHSF